MKTIEDVMALVDKYAMYERASTRFEIEAALRELVESKPLSEDRIETLFKSTELECMSSDDIEDAITFARLIEADHKIGV